MNRKVAFWFFLPLIFALFQSNAKSQVRKGNVDEVRKVDWQNELPDSSSPEFSRDVKIMPVKFIDRDKGGVHLVGQFASRAALQQIDFTLLPSWPTEFFMQTGDWHEKIDRKEFLKNFKKRYWLVIYLEGNGNFVYGATQFKNWETLRISFAQDPDHLLESVDLSSFWKKMRLKGLYFHEIKADMAYWLLLDFKTPLQPDDLSETIQLENGKVAPRRLKYSLDGKECRLTDHGVFSLHKNCTFHIVETKNTKLLKMKMVKFLPTRHRFRLMPVDRDYFIKNYAQELWLCFYNAESKTILRLDQASRSEDDKNPSTGGGKKEEKKFR